MPPESSLHPHCIFLKFHYCNTHIYFCLPSGLLTSHFPTSITYTLLTSLYAVPPLVSFCQPQGYIPVKYVDGRTGPLQEIFGLEKPVPCQQLVNPKLLVNYSTQKALHNFLKINTQSVICKGCLCSFLSDMEHIYKPGLFMDNNNSVPFAESIRYLHGTWTGV